MMLFTQASPNLKDRFGDDIAYSTRVAIDEGWQPFFVPYRLDESADLDVIFATLPTRATPEPAVWLGIVPSLRLYRNVYDALLSRGYALVNTPDQHQRVFELDLAMPLAMGARVGLVSSGRTPAYERAYVEAHPRARMIDSLADIPAFAFG